jgi:hypothetical protein
MIKLNYNSNNSGGDWWLSDEDWLKLEAAGWTVEWFKEQKDGFLRKGERVLGALASSASKDFESPDAGIEEWQEIIGQDPWEEGCNCCGAPHSFSYEDKNGEVHYPNIRRSSSFDGWD